MKRLVNEPVEPVMEAVMEVVIDAVMEVVMEVVIKERPLLRPSPKDVNIKTHAIMT